MVKDTIIKDQRDVETKVAIFSTDEDELLINTVDGKDFYLELHNCWDTKIDYVDIEIEQTLDKQSVKLLIDVLKSMYEQMN